MPKTHFFIKYTSLAFATALVFNFIVADQNVTEYLEENKRMLFSLGVGAFIGYVCLCLIELKKSYRTKIKPRVKEKEKIIPKKAEQSKEKLGKNEKLDSILDRLDNL